MVLCANHTAGVDVPVKMNTHVPPIMYDYNIYHVDFRKVVVKYIKSRFSEQADIIYEFLTEEILKGKQYSTLYRYVKDLHYWARTIQKPFRECTKEDIREAVVMLVSLPVADSTKQRRKVSLKVFFRWLRKCENPEETGWIKTHIKVNHFIPPALLLQSEDIEKMLQASNNLIERTLILLHWETGGRVGETLNLKLKDILFEDQFAILLFNGKTGQRSLPVIKSKFYLQILKENHPHKDDPDAFLFLNKIGRPMAYSSCCKIIRKLAARVGIKKPLNTHFFRKSRATFLAKNGWSESQLCAYHGWQQGSPMPRIYVHMAATDLKKAVVQLYANSKKFPYEFEDCDD